MPQDFYGTLRNLYKRYQDAPTPELIQKFKDAPYPDVIQKFQKGLQEGKNPFAAAPAQIPGGPISSSPEFENDKTQLLNMLTKNQGPQSLPMDTKETEAARFGDIFGMGPPAPDKIGSQNIDPQNQPTDLSNIQKLAASQSASIKGVSPLEMQRLSKFRESLNLEQEGIDALKNYQAKLPTGPGGPDLSGLMMLADAWAPKGSRANFAARYKRPPTAEERMAKKAGVQQLINRAQQAKTGSELKLINAQLANEYKRAQNATRADERRGKELSKWGVRAVEQFNKYAKDYQTMLDKGEIVLGLADSNNPIAMNAIPTFLAKAAGEVGNLSPADREPFTRSGSIKSWIAATSQKAQNGQLDPENLKLVKQLATLMIQKSEFLKNRRAREISKQYGAALTMMSPEDVMKRVRPGVPLNEQTDQDTGPYGPTVNQKGVVYNWNKETRTYE